jgi:hypothetical protein
MSEGKDIVLTDECDICDHDGYCPECSGSGENMYEGNEPCDLCEGSGLCPRCNEI